MSAAPGRPKPAHPLGGAAGAVRGDLGVALSRWAQLPSNELSVLEGVFWLHGPSRDVLSSTLNFSKTRANAVVAGLTEQAWLDEVGPRASSSSSAARATSSRCEGLRPRHEGDGEGLLLPGFAVLKMKPPRSLRSLPPAGALASFWGPGRRPD